MVHEMAIIGADFGPHEKLVAHIDIYIAHA